MKRSDINMATSAFNGTNLGGLVADFSLANTKMSFEFDPAGNQVTADNGMSCCVSENNLDTLGM